MRTIAIVVLDEQRILLTQAGDGMVLSRPVQLPNQMVLCPRGTTLDATLIHRLMARGIKRVFIRGNPLSTPRMVGFSERRERLHRAFIRARDLPHMATLEQILERLHARRP